MKHITHTLALLILLASVSSAQAQSSASNKLVLIPLFEDDFSITYSATAPIVITTPDPEMPDEKVISFTAPANQIVDNMQPSTGLNYVISLFGIFPSRSLATEPLLGGIGMFGGNFAPRGWAFCSGQLQAISQNAALFSLLGTTYGGDGRTTFGLPDLRGRVVVGSSNGSAGPGLTSRRLGSKFGVESSTVIHQGVTPL